MHKYVFYTYKADNIIYFGSCYIEAWVFNFPIGMPVIQACVRCLKVLADKLIYEPITKQTLAQSANNNKSMLVKHQF